MNGNWSDALPPDGPVARATALLRDTVQPAPGLEARVAERQRRIRRRRRLSGGAGAILAVALTTMIARDAAGRGIPVTFALDAPQVRSVALVGDFTDWQLHRVELKPEGSGEWKVTLRLRPGRYRFAYVLDGNEWRGDSDAAPAPDAFGRPTSVLTVVGR